MSDTHPEPQPVPSSFEREFQDAHFHDDDLDVISNDVEVDGERRSRDVPGKKKPPRRPPPRRRFLDD